MKSLSRQSFVSHNRSDSRSALYSPVKKHNSSIKPVPSCKELILGTEREREEERQCKLEVVIYEIDEKFGLEDIFMKCWRLGENFRLETIDQLFDNRSRLFLILRARFFQRSNTIKSMMIVREMID